MSVILSAEHSLKILQWFDIAYKFGDFTDEVVIFLISYFPTLNIFNENTELIKRYAINALNDNDRQAFDMTIDFKGKRNKSPEEKEKMLKRSAILRKIGRAITRLRTELYPPAVLSGAFNDVFLTFNFFSSSSSVSAKLSP